MTTKPKKRRRTLLPLFCLLLLVFFAFSEHLRTVTYTVESEKIHTPIRLVLLTDLHSCYYGDKQEDLLNTIAKAQPDIVCLGGDIFDDVTPHDGTIALLEGLTGQYRCFYITGNHEHWSEEAADLCALVESYGITVLTGQTVALTARNQTIAISGIDDPTGFYETGTYGIPEPDSWYGQLAEVSENADAHAYFNILLSHRPEKTAEYTDSAFDLVLAGHAHGGQVRLPFLLNGLFAPGQGYFPAYAGGQYTLGTTQMIVSRGLCKNDLPRIFNRPEVVVVDLCPPS